MRVELWVCAELGALRMGCGVEGAALGNDFAKVERVEAFDPRDARGVIW